MTDTDPTAIDWLRSTTRTTAIHTRRSGDKPNVSVTHEAVFAIEPGPPAQDLPHEYSRGARPVVFQPRFFAATWTDGKLTAVRVTGRQRLRGGGTGTTERHQSYRPTHPLGIDYATLPPEIAGALGDYVTAVATESAARAGWLRR